MATTTTGRFVWHELHTTDRIKAQKFYTQLMGWETKEVSMGSGEPYTLCLLNGKDFAGITKSMAPKNVPPHWLPYIAVEHVDSSAAKAKELGGKIMNPPMDIPNVGRFAVISDPQGAAFALYADSKPRQPEPDQPPIGGFCWDELSTSDAEAATKFYVGLFGYSGVDSKDMGPMGTYRIVKRGDRQTAGITKMPPNVPYPNWLAFLSVKDIDASTRKATDLGATVFMQPTDIPQIGRFSVFADPTGAVIALFAGAT